MKDQILSDLQTEIDSITESVKEKTTHIDTLKRTLETSVRELTFLEGRLSEVKAVVQYINALSESQQAEEPDDDTENEGTTESDIKN